MVFRRSFLLGLGWRLALLLLAVFAFVESIARDGMPAGRIVAGIAVLAAVAALWRHVTQTNRALAAFLEAVRFGDLSHGFTRAGGGSGFDEIAEALNHGMQRLRDAQHRLSEANRFHEAVLDDTPTALLMVSDDKVELANKAARRLFIRHQGVRTADFEVYGQAFARSLGEAPAGRSRLLPLSIETVPQTAMVSAAAVQRMGGLVRVVAVQPIQGELDAVEIAAQSDLIRVLTHEIMNSMTPVTSLAQSAAKLMAAADKGGDRDVADARAAVETLARRADGVMHFVQSYRQISRTPQVRPRSIDAEAWTAELQALIRATWPEDVLHMETRVEPPRLTFEADPDLMSQVLINLLRNAAEAAVGHADAPRVKLAISRTAEGRVLIEVGDNGPGIAEALVQDIFLPFFTTKAKGTGVGLSLARQVVLAHGGSIYAFNAEGARFRILL